MGAHDKITVELGGNWRWYTNRIPQRSKALGTVRRADGDVGALVRIEGTGRYVQVNAGVIRALPQHIIHRALEEGRRGQQGGPGRGGGKVALDGAVNLQRKQVTLDPETIEILSQFGDGELSLGIRRSAQIVKDRAK
jgi:hypothetical protein